VSSLVKGVGSLLQQTPRSYTASDPSLVTVPPLMAEELVISVTAEVITVGAALLHEFRIKRRFNNPKTIVLKKLFILTCLFV
jgi:hypothetical protein